MGKTKNIERNGNGTCTLVFKDDATGVDGVFDPGANQISLKIDGMGMASMLLSKHFFELLEENDVATHYQGCDVEQGKMFVNELKMFPIEFVWRGRAWGSFCKTYGVKQGSDLGPGGIVETMLKSDDLGDPRILRDSAIGLNLISGHDYDDCIKLTYEIARILSIELKMYGYELIDFKVEFGVGNNGWIELGDEISGGIWRILSHDNPVDPIESAKVICSEFYR